MNVTLAIGIRQAYEVATNMQVKTLSGYLYSAYLLTQASTNVRNYKKCLTLRGSAIALTAPYSLKIVQPTFIPRFFWAKH